MKTVLVLAGGPGTPRALPLPPFDRVIAADGGAEQAAALGLVVNEVVGDLDSIPAKTLAAVDWVEQHPVAKDETDLELALAAALRAEPDQILVLGGAGGRLDHLFGELLLLAAAAYEGVQVDAQLGATAVHVVRHGRTLFGDPGEIVSLFALHGPAHGVTTVGLEYRLRAETLEPGSTRGVSNTFVAREAHLAVEQGVVVALRPNGSAVAERPSR